MTRGRGISPRELQAQAPVELDAVRGPKTGREERGAARPVEVTSSPPLTLRVPGGYPVMPSPSSGTVRPSEDSGFAACHPRRSPVSGGYSPALPTRSFETARTNMAGQGAAFTAVALAQPPAELSNFQRPSLAPPRTCQRPGPPSPCPTIAAPTGSPANPSNIHRHPRDSSYYDAKPLPPIPTSTANLSNIQRPPQAESRTYGRPGPTSPPAPRREGPLPECLQVRVPISAERTNGPSLIRDGHTRAR